MMLVEVRKEGRRYKKEEKEEGSYTDLPIKARVDAAGEGLAF